MIDSILNGLSNIINFIGDVASGFLDFLSKPLAYLLAFLEGIFYFFGKIFSIVVAVVKLFIALFQFFFALVSGLMRTVSSWIGFTPSTDYNLPSWSKNGFETALEQIGGTGLLTVIPSVLIALIWIIFAMSIVKLLGGKGESA